MQITITSKDVREIFVAKQMTLLCLCPLLYMFFTCLPVYQLSSLMKNDSLL